MLTHMQKMMVGAGAVMMLLSVVLIASWMNRPVQTETATSPRQYQNQDPQFTLSFPAEWGVEASSKHQVVIRIDRYAQAPVVLGENDEASTLTQSEMDALRARITAGISLGGERVISAGEVNAVVSQTYNVPSGQFVSMAQFFVGKDLVTLSTILPVTGAPFSWPDDRARIGEITTDIQSGTSTGDVKETIRRFETIVRSLVLPSSVAVECSAPAVTLENGRKQYPISVKYDHLPWLGQLFTADECGSERLEEVAKGGYYSRGSKLWLKSAPSKGLLDALTVVGFHCEGESEDAACVVWRLDTPVLVSKILKLKPFAQEIETDDCVNCG